MTTALYQELSELEIDGVLVDAVEDTDFSLINTAGIGAVRLISSPM